MSLQTRGTCWLYSILNGFLLTNNGQKIIYVKMQEFFDTLNDTQKRIFLDPTDDACPRQFSKVNPFKFYKFFNQFLCFRGGPRGIKTRSGLSPNLLNNLGLLGNVARTYQGGRGAQMSTEIGPIIDALGMDSDDVKVIVYPEYSVSEYIRPGYKWLYSSVGVSSATSGHALTVFKNGIFDSNRDEIIPASKYPTDKEILAYATKRYPKYNYNEVYVDFHLFVNLDRIKNVHPKCERVYRNVKKTLGNVRNFPQTPANVSYYKRELTRRMSKLMAKSKPSAVLGVYESKKGAKFKISSLGTRQYIHGNNLSKYTKTNNVSKRTNRPIYKSKSGSLFTITPKGKKMYYPVAQDVVRRTKFLDYKKRPIFEINLGNGKKKLFVKELGRRIYGIQPRYRASLFKKKYF